MSHRVTRVTVPVDTVLLPVQVPQWIGDCDDCWTPLDVAAIRREYHPSIFNTADFVTRDTWCAGTR